MAEKNLPQQSAGGTKALLKSTAAAGSMTTLSRITGLVRDIMLAQLVGSTLVADAFFVAFRIPNFFRRIFGEGAFSAAFVPVYTDQRINASAKETQRFVDLVTGRLGLILLLITFVGVLASPILVTILAPGFKVDPEKYQITVDSLRITFPYLLFICLVALSAAILNTCGQFAAPAATPILLNLSLIASALWITGMVDNAAIALSIGVFIAGVLQLLFQIPFLAREKALPRPKIGFKEKSGPANQAGEVYRLMIPAIFGSSVAQVNLIINTFIASFLVTGSVSWLYYSDRLMEFPLGVFGVALGTVILPRLSKEHTNVQSQEFSRLLDWGLRWCCLVSLPATVGLIVLAEPILTTLFFHGAFTAHDVSMSAAALIAFATGLIALVAVKVLSPGFFARKDTRTPVRVGVISLVVNAVLCIALVFPLKHVGLALATSVAAFVNAGLLLYLLLKDGTYRPLDGWILFLLRVVGASAIMGGVLRWWAADNSLWLAYSLMERVSQLALLIVAGIVIFCLCILLFGLNLRQLMKR